MFHDNDRKMIGCPHCGSFQMKKDWLMAGGMCHCGEHSLDCFVADDSGKIHRNPPKDAESLFEEFLARLAKQKPHPQQRTLPLAA